MRKSTGYVIAIIIMMILAADLSESKNFDEFQRAVMIILNGMFMTLVFILFILSGKR